ncbi:hypothetical protein GCM10009722_22870 [Williamsia deligens]
MSRNDIAAIVDAHRPVNPGTAADDDGAEDTGTTAEEVPTAEGVASTPAGCVVEQAVAPIATTASRTVPARERVPENMPGSLPRAVAQPPVRGANRTILARGGREELPP